MEVSNRDPIGEFAALGFDSDCEELTYGKRDMYLEEVEHDRPIDGVLIDHADTSVHTKEKKENIQGMNLPILKELHPINVDDMESKEEF